MNKLSNVINYGKHYIDKSDINSVNRVLKSKFLTQGQEVNKFESHLGKYFGSKYVVSLSNGTAGLNLVSKILKWKKGDIIFCSPITFVSSSNCILHQGAKVVFVDINKKTFNIDDKILEKLLKKKDIRNRAKAIIATDYAGNPCNWKALKKISKKNNLILINDNCHAIGASYDNKKKYLNKYADIGVHSYHAVKNITTGEGGSVLTNKKEIFKKLKLLSSHGIIKNTSQSKPWEYEMLDLGFNFRMTDIQAALGISQLNKLNKFVVERTKIAKLYDKHFSKSEFVQTQKVEEKNFSSYHLYPLLINFKKLKKRKVDLFKYLKNKGIHLQVHYKPIYKFKYYKKIKYLSKMKLNNSEKFYEQQISLPIYYKLTKEKQMYVIKNIKNFLNI